MNYVTVILGFIAITAGILALVTGGSSSRAPIILPTEEQYSSNFFGLKFVYPDYYFLEETASGVGIDEQYHITLIEDTLENRNIRENRSAPREGPVTITVDIYPTSNQDQTSEEFIRESGFTNFNLSPDGVIAPVTVAGKQGHWFIWDGLYNGESVVLRNADWIYVFSATYLSSKEQIWQDYRNMIKTIRFQ